MIIRRFVVLAVVLLFSTSLFGGFGGRGRFIDRVTPRARGDRRASAAAASGGRPGSMTRADVDVDFVHTVHNH